LRYNGTTGALLNTFVGVAGGLSNPQGLVFGPGGNLYVSNGSNEVLRFDGATGVLLGAFVKDNPATTLVDESGGLSSPSGLAFGPEGKFLFVSSQANDKILKYDRTSGAFVTAITAADVDGPAALAFSPDKLLYVASSLNNKVVRFDVDGNFKGSFTADSPR
jgi:DNA-binding beta-propeller fold protein YncE